MYEGGANRTSFYLSDFCIGKFWYLWGSLGTSPCWLLREWLCIIVFTDEYRVDPYYSQIPCRWIYLFAKICHPLPNQYLRCVYSHLQTCAEQQKIWAPLLKLFPAGVKQGDVLHCFSSPINTQDKITCWPVDKNAVTRGSEEPNPVSTLGAAAGSSLI